MTARVAVVIAGPNSRQISVQSGVLSTWLDRTTTDAQACQLVWLVCCDVCVSDSAERADRGMRCVALLCAVFHGVLAAPVLGFRCDELLKWVLATPVQVRAGSVQ
jgi:hypothetical protein